VSQSLRLVERPPHAAILGIAVREIQEAIAEPWLSEVLDGLFVQLGEMRRSWPPAKWAQFAADCRAHELGEILREDPFTRRAFRKVRGHAGDAPSLDFLYQHPRAEDELYSATDAGFRVAHYTTTQSALSQSTRYRRRVVARFVERAAAAGGWPHVLSVGCGHLREALVCAAFRDGAIGRFVAVDQDEEALAVVRDELGDRVETVFGSVRSLVDGHLAPGRFHRIYAAGLYEHLPEWIARRLTEVLFGLLHPGGALLIPHFLPATRDAGYLEAVLDWPLVYRSLPQIRALLASLPRHEIAACRSFEDPLGQVGYVEVTRQPGAYLFPVPPA
jgi:SAM-dependent methyltransferase